MSVQESSEVAPPAEPHPIWDEVVDELGFPVLKEQEPTKREKHRANKKAQEMTDAICREVGIEF